MIYILLLISIIVTFLNYCISKYDIIAPAVVSLLTITIALLFTTLGKATWNLNIVYFTALVICMGFGSVTIANMIPIRIKVSQIWRDGENVKINYNLISISMILSLTLTILYGIEAYRVGNIAGGFGLNAFAYMKNMYLSNSTEIRMNFLIRQGFKVVFAIAYVNMFILIYDSLILRWRGLHDLYCIVTIICAVLITIFSGSRTEIMQLLSSGVFIYSVLWREKFSWNNSCNRNTFPIIFKNIFPYSIGFMLFAFISRGMVKMENDILSKTNSFLEYIVFYIGSSFAVLNRKIEYSFSGCDIWFANDLSKKYAYSHVYLGDLNYGGNTSTIFSVVLSNGLLYMTISLFLLILIANIFYKSFVYKTYSGYLRNRVLIMYAMCYFVFTMAFYANCTGKLNDISFIITMMLVNIYYTFIMKSSLKFKFKIYSR